MKFDKNNPWLVGIGVGIISGVLSGVLVGAAFLHREQRIVRNLLATRVKFADKCLKEELAEEALRVYDDILQELQEQDKHLYAYIRNQTARCYLCLAKGGIQKKRNLIRAAVSFEESLRVSGSERSRESIFAELELSGVFWSLSWFQNAEANIAKAVGLFEDVKGIYPELQFTEPFLLMGISPGDDLFRMDPEFPTIERDIKKVIQHGQETLKICTKEKYPVAYGLVQASLGFYHLELAAFENKTANLSKSIRAFSESLEIFVPDEYPLDYIDLNSSIAIGYLRLSWANDKIENLQRAKETLEKALSLATLEGYPDKYAQSQRALGSVYEELSLLRDEEENLNEAITCWKNALKVYKEDKTPFDYAGVQGQLGSSYLQLSEIKDKDGNISRAVGCFEKALNILESYKEDETAFEYVNVREKLGYMYLYLSMIKDKDINIKNSADSFERALKALNAEKDPIRYKRVKLILQFAKQGGKTKGQQGGK